MTQAEKRVVTSATHPWGILRTDSGSWEGPGEGSLVHRDGIHLWRARLDIEGSWLQSLAETLGTEEREKATRYHFRRDRERYIAAHGVLRMILARYLDMSPHAITFCASAFGKPMLAPTDRERPLEFNLAHSGNMLLIAIAKTLSLGVDIERISEDIDVGHLARGFLSPHEQTVLQVLPPERRREAFFRWWTRKEAFVKARGEGLSLPIREFEVIPPSLAESSFQLGGQSGEGKPAWSLWDLTPGVGYVGALAVPAAAGMLHLADVAALAPVN